MEVKRDRILLVLGMRKERGEWGSQWARTRSVHCPDVSKDNKREETTMKIVGIIVMLLFYVLARGKINMGD